MQFIRPIKALDIIQLGGNLIEETIGNREIELKHFCAIDEKTSNGFGFMNSDKNLSTLENSTLDCLLVPSASKEKILQLKSNKTWIFSRNVDLVAQKVKKQFVLSTPYRAPLQGVHPTAVVDSTAEIHPSVVIGPFAVIGKNCSIGEGSFIGSHVVIEEAAVIKNNVTIHPHAYIGHHCEIGNLCEIKPQAVIGSEGYGYAHDHLGNHYRIPHTGKVILGDEVHIGAGTAIDRGTLTDTRIGQGTKIDNQVHLAHNTVVGRNGLITAQIVTGGSTTIGDNFICGGNTAITGHIKITDNVNVAGFSGVSNDIDQPGQYGGYPLQPLKDFLKVKASSVHLPELRKNMSRVLKKLFPEEFN